ncbi:hypothetical protein BDV93DRAFT_545336 [Ceratobasidium sp. AG-I]|nr:hypothetical protein BDV93DRAFT_545336 [Ceratobasidium sp. AG-I]
MRGRGRGNNRGFQNASRGSDNNPNAVRNSTRNWERTPASGNDNRSVKPDDRSALQWLPSVSRSSGLEPNGDALRSFKTQGEYWEFIVEKILNLELPHRLESKSITERQEKEGNAMILLRKLREGFVATKRRDAFAIQVVERSTYLALLYNSPVNVASSFSYLLDTYPPPPITKSEPTSKKSTNEHAIGLLHYLHTLIDEYPSQRTSHRLLFRPRSDTPTCLPRGCAEWLLACEVASALRRSNWWTLDRITSPEVVRDRLNGKPWVSRQKSEDDRASTQDQNEVFCGLPQRALVHLLQELRVKVRSSAWPVLRSAYREVLDGPWLERSLLFPKSDPKKGSVVSDMAEFMRLAVERGEAGVKDAPGMKTWMLRRPV